MEFKTEQQFQAACSAWFWNEYPGWRRMLHCNMNNSADRVAGNKAKAVGVVKGVSDLELIANGGVVWFIELKLPGKKQSEEQIDFETKVRARGHNYVILETLDEFKNLVNFIING